MLDRWVYVHELADRKARAVYGFDPAFIWDACEGWDVSEWEGRTGFLVRYEKCQPNTNVRRMN